MHRVSGLLLTVGCKVVGLVAWLAKNGTQWSGVPAGDSLKPPQRVPAVNSARKYGIYLGVSCH